jgi:hypothetical protein
MGAFAVKVALSALVIAKRSPLWAAALASLPLTSLLAFVWLYLDTGDAMRVATLAQGIFWLVLPSLVLFVALPLLLRAGWAFWPGLALASAATALAYAAMTWLLSRLGIVAP